MAFSLINYASPELSKSPIGDLVSNILGGYQQGLQTRYMKPTLEEQLKKAQLYNQYYGPNMESQIGLRGAQAGHLGSLTSAQNIRNKYLPQQLQDAAAARVDAAKKRQFVLDNPLFGYAGPAGQLGALNYMRQHPELFGSQQEEPAAQSGMQSYIESAPGAMRQSEDEQHTASFSPYEALQQSIMQSLAPKRARTALENAQDYAKQSEMQYGKDSKEAKDAHDFVDKLVHGTPKQKDMALEQHREKMDNMAIWKSLPANAKAHAIAIGQGAGFSADETVKWLASGKDMKDLLYQHGIKDESEVDPVYQLTGSAQSQLLQRQFASKEADYLSKFIRDNTGEYARTVAGYSPKLIKDQLNNKNEEQQAKFLASRGLAPELVNLRLVLANAKSTVHAQKMLADKAMVDIKNFRSLVSNKVWNRTQEIMDDTLQKTFKHAQTQFGSKRPYTEVSKKVSANLGKNSENDPLGIR